MTIIMKPSGRSFCHDVSYDMSHKETAGCIYYKEDSD